MHYTGEVYRPPLEAYTPLLEVTYGCSHNDCVFCTMYNNTPFGIFFPKRGRRWYYWTCKLTIKDL